MTLATTNFLVSPQEASKLQSSGALLIDVRDTENYQKEHVAGAVTIPQIFYHLSTTSDEELRQSKVVFEELFQRAGVTPETLVILYEDGMASRFGGSFRGWWWLSYFGHENALVLDGGFDAWKSAGLPVDSKPVTRERSNFQISVNESVLARRDDVVAAMKDDNVKLLDNRDAVEWFCEQSSPYDTPDKDFSPRRGRIPGATWVEWTELMIEPYTADATFKSSEEIKEIMSAKGFEPEDDVIIYCFKGSRASNTFAALRSAGFTKLRNYLGSWYEWAADDSLPIETGTRD